MNHKTASFYTLGCKLNFSETSTVARDLENEGFARVEFESGADIYVINTAPLQIKLIRNVETWLEGPKI